jgi:predicted phosphohydrolase
VVLLITSLVEVQKALDMLFSCLHKVYLLNRSISIIRGVLVISMALFRWRFCLFYIQFITFSNN